MENQWPTTPPDPQDSELGQLQRLTCLLLDAPEIMFAGIGSVSLKSSVKDPFGDPQEVLHYQGPASAATFSLTALKRILALEDASQLTAALGTALRTIGSCPPDLGVTRHAVLPGNAVIFCSPTALMILDLQTGAAEKIKSIFTEKVLWLSEPDVLAQAKALSSLTFTAETEAVFIHNFGLFVFGADPQTTYERLVALVSLAEAALGESLPGYCASPDGDASASPQREMVAGLRYTLSAAAGTPLLMRVLTPPALTALSGDAGFRQRLMSASLTVPLADVFGGGLLNPAALPDFLPGNNALLNPELGLVITGQTAADLAQNVDLACKALQAAHAAWASGGMADQALQPGTPPAPNARREHDKDTMFIGEIALVTGAASGIGRGCALALLQRGAAVIGLDINPAIKDVSDSPAYLGLVCDLTDEAAVQQVFEQAVQAFGGLDMIVLNAGIFPKSALVSEMKMSMWQQVMHINLDVNVTILRESYPLLKQAPESGRVLVNASRNVPAPGPGAAAYSTSKAGLTQLARVAALEWGKDGIRVNMIHPHAVFDTGIWTDEVLQGRAEKYGVTVQEYKTRNVLKVELTSHDIGELVCEMLGPVFSKTTGAQVPVDGGSDRVI